MLSKLEIICNTPFIFTYLLKKCLPLVDNVWVFMTIDIHSLFSLLAFIAKSELEPLHCSWLRDHGLDLKHREYDMIYMMAQCPWGYTAERLSHKVNVHIIQDCLIVEE